MIFGWKKKAEILRMVILSSAHQLAKELSPGLSRLLEIYKLASKTTDDDQGMRLLEEIADIKIDEGEVPVWEPIEVGGWKIAATLYLQNGQLWWLVHATRRSERSPSDRAIAALDKVLAHLGADPTRDAIIGPCGRADEEPLPMGWWTWFNTQQLYEIQVNKDKPKREMIRVVPIGVAETDGYKYIAPDADDAADEGNDR